MGYELEDYDRENPQILGKDKLQSEKPIKHQEVIVDIFRERKRFKNVI